VPIGVNPWQKKSQPSIATMIATVPFQKTTDLVEKLRTQNVVFEELHLA